MKIQIIWNSAKESRPEESGEYLCYTKNQNIQQLHYSKKFDLFNCYDYDISKINAKNGSIEIVYWTKLENIRKKLNTNKKGK